MVRQTHTYVTLAVSEATYQEVAQKLRAAGYDHVFNEKGEIDLHGIAFILEKETPNADNT